MGNHLAATAPSQILSVDSYLGDAADYQFDRSLGNTRFMKVARVKCEEGFAVVKVFVIHDPSLDLEAYKEQVENIRSKLKHASNCLPYQNIMLTEKAALLFRQYVKHNLYDRISTRPFYNMTERRWVAFQLLCALNQMAKLGMCHGDIKSENVMITAWNWLLLTDFASYKPTSLPDDNPADFNYFFDTSRRRVCYIAPERFVETSSVSDVAVSKQPTALNHSMDIFSAGCVIAELFTDGSPPFDFSQLLAFRYEDGKYPKGCMSKIDDPHIRSLVEHMIQKDPQNRYTAEQYLTKWKGKAFPLEFYSYLKKYLGRFCEPPLLSSDQTINLLHSDLRKIQENLVEKAEAPESLIIVISLVLSCIRRLKYCDCKLKALEILTECAKHLPSKDILERLVPHLMELVTDKKPRVRASAFRAVAVCTSYVRYVPQDEVGIFTDYIFPGTAELAHDVAVLVRQSYAQHISLLAETALRFLNSSNYDQNNSYMSTGTSYQPSYDFQLQNLHEIVQERVQVLFSDTDSTVRQCLLEHSVAKLCCFFGRQKCNDVILSHMITFLNDKQDWQLRSAFFDSLIQVAIYIGWQSAVILKPLLQQGLNDSEEFVISKTLNALTSLSKVGLLSKQMTFDLIREVIPLLQHPCKWIRLNTVGFLCACSKTMNIVDLQCRIVPKLDPYLTHPVVLTGSETVLMSVLKPAVKRNLYDLVLSSSHIGMFLNLLKSRKVQRHSFRPDEKVVYDDISDESVSQTFQKLSSYGLQIEDEEKLLNLCEFLLRQNRHRATVIGITAADHDQLKANIVISGQLDFSLAGHDIVRRHAELVKATDEASAKQSKKTPVRKKTSHLDDQSRINEDWKNLYGRESTESTKKKSEAKKTNLADAPISMSQLEGITAPQVIPAAKVKPPPIQLKYTSCKLNLRTLVHHKRDMYLADMMQKDLEENIQNNGLLSDPWRLRGQLVAHMVEHRGPIHRIAVSPQSQHFATVSSDRSVKLWDCEKLEGKAMINQSKATCTSIGEKLHCVTFCGEENIVCATATGLVHSIAVQTMSNSINSAGGQTQESITTPDLGEPSRVMDMASFQKAPIVIYITSDGNINMWDLRVKRLSCSMKHDLHYGLMTSLVVDLRQHWLCVATVSGKHVCWDLRFRLPITHVSHPSLAGARRLAIHPTHPSCVLSAVTGNNEISIWDLENSSRTLTLWASTAPALSLRQKSQDSVNGLLVVYHEDDLNVYTGGTDSTIRLWDLKKPTNSKIISEPAHPQQLTNVTYSTRRVEGTTVVQEHVTKTKKEVGSLSSTGEMGNDNRNGAVETCHRDVITDIALLRGSQNMLVSTSRDGVVKLWK